VKQEKLTFELDRRLDLWQTVVAELKQEAERRAVLETELSQALRSTVEGQEAERQRIARELHDTLGQTLTLLQLGLDGLGRVLPTDTDLQSQLAALKGLANNVGSEVNRLAWEIRPTALDDLGLETAIRHLTEIWAERSNLQFGLHLALNGRRLDPQVETTLYRVLQEALVNIVRHASATRVGVLLEATEIEVRMIVEDNGRGFSTDPAPGGVPAKRLGLLGIRERLSLVSGALEVESSPGHGCTLFVSVPL
jgi:signal transduction histidine kinase